jgi:BASS family bile acid:Na+ symporter
MDEHFFSILKGFAGVAIPLAAFATGLTATSKNPLWLARHPGLLLRSLLVILLIVPVGVVLFLEAVGAPVLVKVGLTIAVISIGIGPPMMFQKAKQQTQDENVAYEIGLNVTLLVLAMFYVPLAVGVYAAAFGYDVQLGVGQVAKVVLTRALVPLLLGLLVGRLLPRVVKPIARYGGIFVMVVLLALIVVALIASWRGLIGLGARTWLTCVAIVLAEIVVGHLVGSADRNSRTMLVAFTTMRFPVLALLLASITRHRREIIPVILAYIITSFILTTVYSVLISRRKRSEHLPQPVPPRTVASAT